MSATTQQQRPLTWWQQLWRSMLALVFGLLLWVSVADAEAETGEWLILTDLALGIVSMVAMLWHRRWPFAIALLTNSLTALSMSSAGAAAICGISLATRRQWREILPVCLVGLVAGQIFYEVAPQPEDIGWYLNLAIGVLFSIVIVAIGMYIGARRDLIATLQDRAERAESEQALRVSRAQVQERNRIAREMHDVLAHRMSLVAMHAGALAFRDDLSTTQTRQTAEIIQANSHRALSDLREILGVLRDTDADRSIEAPPDRPQPTLVDLEELVADERATGAQVVVSNRIEDVGQLPDSVGRTVYRIVQEGLTNARKHAPDTKATVQLSGAPGQGVSLEVRNPTRLGNRQPLTPTSGFGLVGLAERAALSEGRFEHGVDSAGDFVLRVWLPWPT